MRRIVDLPVGSSGLGRVSASMKGRWKSVTSTPKSASSSAIEPYTSVRGYAGSSETHTGIGAPQKRLREIDQSRAPSSHLPKMPCLVCAGVQVISSFSSTMRSRIWVTRTNQDDTALYMRGLRQRQQCG